MKGVPLRSVVWAVVGSLVVLSSGSITILHSLQPATSIPLYMLLIVVVAWQGGFRAAIAVSLSATLGLDFFFTEPHFSLRVSSPQDIFSVVAFACVSLLISHLSHRIRSKSDELVRAEGQQRALYELSRSIVLQDWKEAVGSQLCSLTQERLHLLGVALWDAREPAFAYAGETANAMERLQAAYRAERSYDLPNRTESVRILRFGVRSLGAVLFRGNIEPLMADAVTTLIATHIERIRAVKAEVSAESQAISERLRTTVLDGLAHAVKTPLTTIVVSSSGLRVIGSLTPLQDELAQVIESQASYLADLANKLLRTAKLDERDIVLQPRFIDFTDLYREALAELPNTYDTHRIVLTTTAPRGPLFLDPDLFRMVLVQLLENALKYSIESSRVRVDLIRTQTSLALSVHNEGSYIPAGEIQLVFERYYRSASMEHRAPGTGIGLSVAKHAMETLGGRVWVESSEAEGTTFHIALPLTGEEHASGLRTHR